MDFPLENIHRKALKAHEASNCAGEQGKFWEMHARIFETKAMTLADLTKHGEEIGLNMQEYQQCLDSGKYVDEIRKDMAEGRKAGTTGTPAFYLGVTDPDSTTIKVTKYIKGAQPYDRFAEAIDELLGEKK